MTPRWSNEAGKKIVEELYRAFATDFSREGVPTAYQQWFNGASVVPNHPIKMTTAIEIQANYYPAAELNRLVEIATKHGMPYHIKILNN